jgi:hypothetical protein
MEMGYGPRFSTVGTHAGGTDSECERDCECEWWLAEWLSD